MLSLPCDCLLSLYDYLTTTERITLRAVSMWLRGTDKSLFVRVKCFTTSVTINDGIFVPQLYFFTDTNGLIEGRGDSYTISGEAQDGVSQITLSLIEYDIKLYAKIQYGSMFLLKGDGLSLVAVSNIIPVYL